MRGARETPQSWACCSRIFRFDVLTADSAQKSRRAVGRCLSSEALVACARARAGRCGRHFAGRDLWLVARPLPKHTLGAAKLSVKDCRRAVRGGSSLRRSYRHAVLKARVRTWALLQPLFPRSDDRNALDGPSSSNLTSWSRRRPRTLHALVRCHPAWAPS